VRALVDGDATRSRWRDQLLFIDVPAGCARNMAIGSARAISAAAE